MEFLQSDKKGFSLIEIMVVIVIMGILAAVAVPNLFGAVEKTKERADLQYLFYIKKSFERHYAEEIGTGGNATTGQEMFKASGIGGQNEPDAIAETYLKQKRGIILVQIQINKGLSTQRNDYGYQGYKIGTPTNEGYKNGLYRDVLNEAGFAKIAQAFGNGKSEVWLPPPFKSKTFLYHKNRGGVADNDGESCVRIRWKNGDPNTKEIVVWFGGEGSVLQGLQGTIFATDASGMTIKKRD